MQVSRTDNINFHKNSTQQNFGLKISESANTAFKIVNDFFDASNLNHIENNPGTTKFVQQMTEIRGLLKGAGIIHRKGGTGLCVSIPNVFKEYKSKPDTIDIKLDFLFTPNQYSLIKLKSLLKGLEREYIQNKKTYFDIHGKEFVPAKIFSDAE